MLRAAHGAFVFALALAVPAVTADEPASVGHRLVELDGTGATAGVYERAGRVRRVYGSAFARGATPEAAATTFLQANAHRLGARADDLVLERQQPIMYDRGADRYRFTGLDYVQVRDGVPVFRSKLRLLVRDEPGHPVVLASVDLHDLGAFRAGRAGRADPADAPPGEAHLEGARVALPALTSFTAPRTVIWAGVEDDVVAPRLAVEFVGEGGVPGTESQEKWLFLADAQTGEIIYLENQILNHHPGGDVTGNVSGNATEGPGADTCEAEVLFALPYARVAIGGSFVYADENGDYSIPGGGGGSVTVSSGVRGEWFRVFNQGGADTILSQIVSPPAVADFVHNELNNSEFIRAEVNGYLQANIARDYTLFYNPAYPTIGTQTEFEVNVNSNGSCNAGYTGGSINFFRAGGGCTNMAFSAIVHHEYGHHLVATGGSGQSEYGEGMGDSIGVIILDVPESGLGVFGDCAEGGRTADNDCQYQASGCSSCGSAIHTCGTLLSGCIWSTREELIVTEPGTYRDILSNLTINSILVHTGTSIDPGITIDFLTLDDDNETIFDGTPHYNEIAAGFGLHNMDAPPLALLGFTFPDGMPELIAPAGGTTMRVEISGLTGVPQPGSGSMFFDDGGGPVEIPMTEIEPNVYDATFPATACGTAVSYYFGAMAEGGGGQLWPVGAPAARFHTVSATGTRLIASDDFETDTGWTVENVDLTDGGFDRGVPVGGGDRGDPATDFDGSGACYLTDNEDDNSDVDGGPTRVISPVYDLSAVDNPWISYARWFTNDDGDADRLDVHVSANGGASWVLVESVGHMGDWQEASFAVANYVTPSAQVRVRFSVTDNPNDSITEGGVDAVEIVSYLCDEPMCVADIDGSGDVGFTDLVALLAAWGPCPGCPEDLDDSGDVGFTDLVSLLAEWGPCP